MWAPPAGGARGLPSALAEKGVQVVVNGRHPETVGRVVERITGSGGKAVGYAVGVHTEEGAKALTDFLSSGLTVSTYWSTPAVAR